MLLLTAKPISASEMETLGPADQVTTAGALRETAIAHAQTFAEGSVEAFADIKRLTSEAERATFQDHLALEKGSVVALAKLGSAQRAISRMLQKRQ